MSYPKITNESYLEFSPSQPDHLADFTAGSLHASLDSIVPVKKKTKLVKSLAPWYNLNTRNLKQKTHKHEKKCIPLNWKSHTEEEE